MLRSYGQRVEDLEESQVQLQSMLGLRHVVPFKEEIQEKLKQLSGEYIVTNMMIALWSMLLPVAVHISLPLLLLLLSTTM